MNTTVTAAKMSDSRQRTVDRSAFEAAIALLRQPSLSRKLPRAEIPSDVLALIKISAGDQELLLKLSDAHGVSEADVLAASKLYLQSILSTARDDDRRMLCLPSGAVLGDFKEHKKWLLKWLHPDRNDNSWESALFLKVNEAFNRLQATTLDSAAHADVQLRVQQRSKTDFRQQRKRQLPAYRRTGIAGLFHQTAKPILIVACITLLGCLVFFSTISQWSTGQKFFSNFAFSRSFD